MKKLETEEKYFIWDNTNLDVEDFRDWFEEDIKLNGWDIDKNDEHALYDYMVDINNEYLNDARMNLEDIVYDQPILVLAELGLWNGKISAYKYVVSGKVSDCLSTDHEYAEWYVDGHGDMRANMYHHDGTNHYLYRVLKDDIRDEDFERFEDAIFEGKVNDADIEKYTERIGDDIAKVYGWEISTLNKEQEMEKNR